MPDWDERWSALDADELEPRPPADFADLLDELPRTGTALDLACGPGREAAWLAQRGLDVTGWDASAVAIERATALAARHGIADHCRFAVIDLDERLPDGPPADLVLCQRFRQPDRYAEMAERVRPGGVLAISVLSEVGGTPGRFRAAPGELARAFDTLGVIDHREQDGLARLLAVRSE